MTAQRKLKMTLLALAALACALPDSLWACPACFGNPDSSMSQGLSMGILTLLSVTAVVLSGFIAFIVTLVVRARRHAAREPGIETTTTEGSVTV